MFHKAHPPGFWGQGLSVVSSSASKLNCLVLAFLMLGVGLGPSSLSNKHFTSELSPEGTQKLKDQPGGRYVGTLDLDNGWTQHTHCTGEQRSKESRESRVGTQTASGLWNLAAAPAGFSDLS